jgi:hypothetical protein
VRWQPGPQVRQRIWLAVVLLLGAWLVVAGPEGADDPPAGQGPPASFARAARLAEVWPAARVAEAPGRLADGAEYLPLLYTDPQTSVGTAPSPDGSAGRLVLRGPGGERELRRVDAARSPQFYGFVRAGDAVYWAESSAPSSAPSAATAAGPVETRLWRALLAGGDPVPILPAADAGAATFFGSEHDLVVAGGRVYWAAAAPGAAATEIRSVPDGGGPVTVQRVEGEYQLSAWPWLRSVAGTKGPVQLHNLQTGARIAVSSSAAERVACGPAWCRSLVTTGSDQTVLYELVRTDGTDRRRIGGPSVSAAVADVALLDRFEPMLETGDPAAAAPARRLALYDIRRDTTVRLAEDAGAVMAGASLLWWQTGRGPDARWHCLDLSTLG